MEYQGLNIVRYCRESATKVGVAGGQDGGVEMVSTLYKCILCDRYLHRI